MRKNRKRQLHARVLPHWAASIIVLVVTLVLGYWFMDSKCAMLGQEIRKHERRFSTLEDERLREEARWNEKKTPEKLDQAMLQHGLAMSYPTHDQVVRMDGRGVPVPGQQSVAKLLRYRIASEPVAKAGQR
jgi:hypothetical protein